MINKLENEVRHKLETYIYTAKKIQKKKKKKIYINVETKLPHVLCWRIQKKTPKIQERKYQQEQKKRKRLSFSGNIWKGIG